MYNEIKVSLERWYNECAVQQFNDVAEMPPIIREGLTRVCVNLNTLIKVVWDEDTRLINVYCIRNGYITKWHIIYKSLSDIVDVTNWDCEVFI